MEARLPAAGAGPSAAAPPGGGPREPPATSSDDLFALFGSDSSDDDDTHGGAQPEPVDSLGTLPPAAGAAAAAISPPWEVVTSGEADGGKGLRATADIKQDAVIYREPAALRCPNATAAASYEEALKLHQQCVQSHFQRLPIQRRAKLMLLFSLDKYNDAEGKTTIWGIFQTNAVRLAGRDEGDGGLFPVRWRAFPLGQFRSRELVLYHSGLVASQLPLPREAPAVARWQRAAACFYARPLPVLLHTNMISAAACRSTFDDR